MSIANSNIVAKIAAVAAGLALVFSTFAVPAQAATEAELQAQIDALLAQLKTLSGGTTTGGAAFTADMTIGASGAEVTRLQNWLISKGYAIPAGATGYFGAQTAAALAKYQVAKGITPAAGYFGPMTRASVNAELGTSGGSTGGSTGGNTSGDLEGGAGSIDDYELLSGLSNEEVGEDEEDVEVAGLEVEVDDGSDIEITAVRLVFEEGANTNSDFEDYAAEVSIMVDGEEVARVDGDELGEDDDADNDGLNDWTKTISLDGGAIIRAGETGEITVAITGQSNLDSNDVNDSWTVDFTQVRFRDANGASISEDPATGARTFSFKTFAAAADAELKVSLTDGDDADEINDAHVLDIDDSDDTDGVEVLAFTFEVKGDSDLTVDEIPVLFTTVEAAGTHFDDPDDVAIAASLWMDGDEIASENFSSADADGDTETITFEDLGLELEAGEEYEFVVSVDLMSTADPLDNGDTIKAEIGSTERGNIDVEDEAGEQLVSGDRTGTAVGGAHGTFDAGITAEFVSADETVTSPETGADRATLEIVFDVTAFDTDVYVDGSAITDETGGSGAYQDIVVNNAVGTGVVTTTADSKANDTYLVREGETERFTVTINAPAGTDGFVSAALESILYATSAVDGDTVYNFNMGDYKTDSVYLDTNA